MLRLLYYLMMGAGFVTATVAPLVLGGGAILALYLAIRRRRPIALAGVLFLGLSALSILRFEQLWGWHELFGRRFVLNEYDVPALIGALTLAGWAFTLAALRRPRARAAQPSSPS